LKTPIVSISGRVRDEAIPRVMVDHAAIGKLAAEHLLARGYRNFGFFGENAAYSEDRQAAFVRALATRGYRARSRMSAEKPGERQRAWSDEMNSLARWINDFAAPVGVFVASDQLARMFADACLMAEKRVPEDVGIIGTDNDAIYCEFGSPTLTS